MQEKRTIGWREWLGLPELGIDRIKAKVDTGARSSSLHAFDLEVDEDGPEPVIHFSVHTMQRDSKTVVRCSAPLHEYRVVRSSNGHRERRPIIRTAVLLWRQLAHRSHPHLARPDGLPHAPGSPSHPQSLRGRPRSILSMP